jgi:hypothetical protein
LLVGFTIGIGKQVLQLFAVLLDDVLLGQNGRKLGHHEAFAASVLFVLAPFVGELVLVWCRCLTGWM